MRSLDAIMHQASRLRMDILSKLAENMLLNFILEEHDVLR